MQVFKCAGMKVYKYASMQTKGKFQAYLWQISFVPQAYSHVHICMSASMQVCKYVSMQESMYACMQECKCKFARM